MNAIFESNLKALEETPHARHLLDDIKDAIDRFKSHPDGDDQSKVLKLIDGKLGTKNLLYVRKAPAFQGLYHTPDAISEAHQVIRNVNMKHPQLVMVMGMGLGYLLEAFMSIKTKETWGVMVIEKDPDIFVRAMAVTDLTDYFKNTEIRWVINKEVEMTKAHLVSFFEQHQTVNRSIKILASPMALESENDYYAEVARSVISSRDQATIWAGNSVEDNFVGFSNTMMNLEFLNQNPGILPLKNKFKGKVCLSVAAGPSLNEAWDIIKSVQGRIPIIACDTLVKPMNDRGIAPDIVTALERDPIVADFFRGQPIHERSTLIGPSLLLPDSWKCFEGRKLSYCSTTPYTINADLLYLGAMAPGSSAGNLNLALASWMGFSTVIMIGHNLAFAHGSHESHVKGTIDKTREHTKTEEEIRAIATGGKVPTQDGESEVYTIMEYNLFRKQIEALIAHNPQMTFINTAAKGNKIAGTKYLPLQEAVNEYAKEDFDFYPALKEALGTLDPVLQAKRAHRVFDRLTATLKSIAHYENLSQEMEKKIANWRSKIEADEAQGKKWSLDKLNSKLDEVLQLKVEAVNEDPAFSAGFIGVISPVHLVFERNINELIGTHEDDYSLKKDFLLQHERYFRIWNKWLPMVKAVYLETKERFEPLLPPRPDDLMEERIDPKIPQQVNFDVKDFGATIGRFEM